MNRLSLLLLLILFFGCLFTNAQTNSEETPSFPGGNPALFSYMGKNIIFPSRCKTDSSFTGCKVFVKFMVNEDGSVSDPEILKGCPGFPECDAEVLRVIRAMPQWIPASQEGKPFKRSFALPVQFRLQ